MELLDVNEEVQFNFNQESLICSFLLLRIFANQPKKKYSEKIPKLSTPNKHF